MLKEDERPGSMASKLWNGLCKSHGYISPFAAHFEPKWDEFIKKGQEAKTFRICRVHIRKTAGSMAGQFLKNYFPKLTDGGRGAHKCWWEIWDSVHRPGDGQPWDDKNGLFYTIVRNPFDWLVSVYHYFALFNQIYQFEEFAMTWIHQPQALPRHGEWARGGWVDMCHDLNLYAAIFEDSKSGARCRVHVIIKYEFIEEGLNKILQQFGISSKKVPVINKSDNRKHHNYKHYYERDPVVGHRIVEGLLKKHAAEFEMFGYDFDGPINDSVFINPANLILTY